MVVDPPRAINPRKISFDNLDLDDELQIANLDPEVQKQVKFGKTVDVSDAESFKSQESKKSARSNRSKSKSKLTIEPPDEKKEAAPALFKKAKRSKKIITDSDED